MFISQLHPRSQATVFILVVFFQQYLPPPGASLQLIPPGQVRDVHQGTQDDADGAELMGMVPSTY